ncbi:hypothetical protein OR60_00820 [Xanthomonas vesicatoria]|uniref:Uncharacterized protein n=1 Tax=Xanthomonas vesicatoria TaxID=56460 RepID=A0AAJ0IZC0_9XANT|nr:hypothetical protein BI313_08120 [Xanthomonas vesicatoria]KHM95439.1 hypothetical protein OR61_08960 [Xanthomonas vesicatoria]KHM98270.1 hypothetical protein OR60_00820 [Xanthomonas vesicatoria]
MPHLTQGSRSLRKVAVAMRMPKTMHWTIPFRCRWQMPRREMPNTSRANAWQAPIGIDCKTLGAAWKDA